MLKNRAGKLRCEVKLRIGITTIDTQGRYTHSKVSVGRYLCFTCPDPLSKGLEIDIKARIIWRR